jgi:hypothetical protein
VRQQLVPGGNRGCSNTTGAGARLDWEGVADVAQDTLKLRASNLPPGTTALFFQGTTRANGRSGRRVRRRTALRGRNPRARRHQGGAQRECAFPEAGDAQLSSFGPVPSGGVRDYQVHYRNSADFCTSATFNTTGALEVRWL